MVSLKIAYRYFKGRGSLNAVPVLSTISIGAVAIASAAMVILFSVFNGLEGMVKDMYKTFYPEVKVTLAKGKFFDEKQINLQAISLLKDVVCIAGVIEDNVLAGDMTATGQSANRQKVAIVKGVDASFFKVHELSQYIEGDTMVSEGHPYTAIVGNHIYHQLGLDARNNFSSFDLYYSNPELVNPETNPESAFQSLKLHPAGTFIISDEFDDKYILAPKNLVAQLLKAEGMLSSIDIKTAPGAESSVKKTLQTMLPNGFVVATRYEQNKTVYMMMAIEKWVMYFILLFVLIIASFNMVGGLTMMVLVKRKDIAILRTLGLDEKSIKSVFRLEGMIWSAIGGGIGILLGLIICFLQFKFGFVKLGGTFLVDAYPVQVFFTDVLVVIATVLLIGFVVSRYPAKKALKLMDETLKSA